MLVGESRSISRVVTEYVAQCPISMWWIKFGLKGVSAFDRLVFTRVRGFLCFVIHMPYLWLIGGAADGQ